MLLDSLILGRRRFLLLAAAATRARAGGDDFWNRKPAAQWDAGETYRLLNASPWATQVQASDPGPNDTYTATFSPPGKLPHATWHHPDAGAMSRPCVVTWESARPIRDALKAPL